MMRWIFGHLMEAMPAVCAAAAVLGNPVQAEMPASELMPDIAKSVITRTLSNGIRVIMYRRGEAPIFSAVVSVRVGGVDEPEGSTGIAHLLEHMAFKGTSSVGTRDFAKEKPLLEKEELLEQKAKGGTLTAQEKEELQAIEKELGGLWRSEEFTDALEIRGATGLNATTDKEMTNYFLSLPQPAFEYWAWLESERMVDPVMRQFYKERDVVMEERRMRYENDPGGKLYEDLLSVAYQKHQYRHPVIGYPQDISGLMADQLATFHQKHYVPENIAISIVGSIDPDRDAAILERYFGRLTQRVPPALKTTTEPPQSAERQFVVKKDAAPQFMVAYHKPAFPDHDDPPISIFEEIVAGGPLSPLYQGLVKKGHYASSVSAEEAPGLLFPNLVVFGIDPLSTVGNKPCLAAFDAILKATIDRGVTDKQLDIAKRRIARRFLDQLDSNSTLAHNFATSTVLYGNWNAMLTWYQETMAVTVADVNRVAKQYFKDELRTVGLLEREDRRANK